MTVHRIQFNRPLRHVALVGMEEQVADLVPAGAAVEGQLPTEPAVQDNTNEILRTIATEIEALEQQAVATRQELLRTSVSLSRMIVEQLVGSSSNLQEQRLTHLVEQALNRSSEAVEVHLNQANLAVI